MKLYINRDHFSSGLAKVQSVVSARALMPILQNVLLKAEDGILSLTTTNLDNGISCHITANVEQPGTITLPVKKLAAIIKALPSFDVRISVNGHKATIEAGSSHYTIAGIDSSEFPPLPSVAADSIVKLPQVNLLNAIKSVSFAQSADEYRYAMRGILFKLSGKTLGTIATDGKRLAIAEMELPEAVKDEASFIIPTPTVALLERTLGNSGSVSIQFAKTQASIIVEANEAEAGLSGNILIVSKLVDGSFPDYARVLPTQNGHTVEIPREVFLNSVRRTALMTGESPSVKFSFSKEAIQLSSKSAQFGEGENLINVENTGPDAEASFNPAFISDPLKALTCDKVSFTYFDGTPIGVLKGPENYQCVIMGMQN